MTEIFVPKETQDADVVITTAKISGRGAPVLVAEDVVREMRRGSVIVDLAAGFAGTKNTLFKSDRTLMVFGSAERVVSAITEELKEQ